MMDKPKTTLTDGSPVTPGHDEIDPVTGLQKGYVVLSDEERAKGFVQPVRTSYVHVGIRPEFETREIDAYEKDKFPDAVVYEKYPESMSPKVGRYWSKEDLESGCNLPTTINQNIAETYARDPKFYGSTYCAGCRDHFGVAQFVWQGTELRVGDMPAKIDKPEIESARRIKCNCCDIEFTMSEPHSCIPSKIFVVLNREIPTGNNKHISRKHNAEIARAIYSEVFDWKTVDADGVPLNDDGEHLFLLRVADTGDTRVLYGNYSDLRHEIELAADDRISAYMVIK